MAFWLAIDQEQIKFLNDLVSIDIYLKYIIVLALEGLPEKPINYFQRRSTILPGSDFSKSPKGLIFEGGEDNAVSSPDNSSTDKQKLSRNLDEKPFSRT